MPSMTGYEVLGALRKQAELVAVPIVAVTANAMQRDIERGIKAGFARYLTKPFVISEFLETVDSLLTRTCRKYSAI
ncbi:response regulator [Methylogaea oryzae]|nr:response regulator [Methylogaea oryzae]